MTFADDIIGSSSPSPSVIVFVRTSSTARLPVYEALAKKGYALAMVHPLIISDFAPHFKYWIESETNDARVVEECIRTAMKEHKFSVSAVISFDEYGVFPAAVVAESFSLQSFPLPPAGLKATSIKSDFRTWCVEHQINAPKAVKLTPQMSVSLQEATKRLGFPVVVKPSPGAGSMLTTRCENFAQLQAAVPRMWVELQNHPSLAHLEAMGTKAHLLVEEYIGGQEVDVDCVVINGEIKFCAISDNFEVLPPFFCERGGLTPSHLPEGPQEKLRNLLKSFVDSHGTDLTGVLHFEAKYDFDRQDAFVIEVNCRPGSAETHTMIETVYGVSLGECLVRLALHEPLNLDSSIAPRCYTASVNIYPEKEGVLKTMRYDEATPGLVRFVPLAPGSCLAPPPKSFALMAWAVARGETAETAIENINHLTSSVEVITRPACVLQAFADGVENGSFSFGFSV